MDSVLVKVYDDGNYFMEFYTDSTGIFSAGSSKSHNSLFGPRCKEVKLEFSKNGFISETYTTREGEGSVMIYMRK